MAPTASAETLPLTEKRSTFFPLATMRVEASANSALASISCNFLLAETVSAIRTRLASMNLAARAQLVQPFRW